MKLLLKLKPKHKNLNQHFFERKFSLGFKFKAPAGFCGAGGS